MSDVKEQPATMTTGTNDRDHDDRDHDDRDQRDQADRDQDTHLGNRQEGPSGGTKTPISA